MLDPGVSTSAERLEDLARTMAAALRHRGPDDCGSWVDPEAGIGLGHTRLAVVDLSREGHQPMVSADGRYVLAYNGEIYNFRELRRELENARKSFRGHSDTEVVLGAVMHWGLRGALKRFNGMFAFALWDRHARQLHLARDRYGEKPLYYRWTNNVLLFASELKALRATSESEPDIDRDALALFLRHNCVPAPFSIYRGVSKLPPAAVLTVRSASHRGEPASYWSLRDVVQHGQQHPFVGNASEAGWRLSDLLGDAVSCRMVADVPLGAFLSGGIDSSAVVAAMQSRSATPVRTFTIGSHDRRYDEAPYAREIARHLGTEHTELYVSADDTMSVIPKLPTVYDEPFADSSQIPTLLVSELARTAVTVSLSGDGGDELFGGYNRHHWARNISRSTAWAPRALRATFAGALDRLASGRSASVLTRLQQHFPGPARYGSLQERIEKVHEILLLDDPGSLYLRLASHWKEPASIVVDGKEPGTFLTRPETLSGIDGVLNQMMYLDALTYLPDDILVKLDRATMAVSLEARVPFLDVRLAEFAWSLPPAWKVRGGQGKWILRRALAQHVPPELFQRPKMGFSLPMDEWLRGRLRPWAEELLSLSRLREEGFFEPAPIRDRWQEHVDGVRDWQHYLWDILMFEAWLEEQRQHHTS